ncbi:hypothetical protein BGX30_013049 [Mortierella sp. GBA39]|nr:hypothetical protein BGX30_013049 [Mortierella sp. GBA39]
MRELLSRSKVKHHPDPLPIAKHTTSFTADATMSTPSVTSSTSAATSFIKDPTVSTEGLTSFNSSASATSITTTEAGEGRHVFFDPSTAEAIMLKIAGVDVGARLLSDLWRSSRERSGMRERSWRTSEHLPLLLRTLLTIIYVMATASRPFHASKSLVNEQH